jgi:hypothetical protein
VLLGPIISRFFPCSNEEKIKTKTKGACSSPISLIKTLSIIALGIMGLIETLSIMTPCIVIECHYAVVLKSYFVLLMLCHNAKCLYAECHYTESLGTLKKASVIVFELGLESKYVLTLFSNKLECLS